MPLMEPLSPLDTLRQLKEMLDAGALTPAEFEALKQRLVFGAPAGAGPAPLSGPPLPPAQDGPAAENSAAADEASAPKRAPAAVADEPAAPFEPAAVVPPAAVRTEPAGLLAPIELPADERGAARNPLAFVLAVGGVLVFLAVVLYLSWNRSPSERLTSTSQTAADSLAAPVETGPQAAPLPPVAAPETVRLAPARPAPPVAPRPAPSVRDSVAGPPAAPAGAVPDSAAGR